LGDHVKVRRLDLGLTQQDAAVRLAVNSDTVRNWEAGRTNVAVQHYPAVIRFLGYNPLPAPVSIGSTIQRERMTRGWSRRRLAVEAAVDQATVKRLENGTRRMARRVMNALCRALGVSMRHN
jgi:transcriptional regulator with XRE-family HTH domain